MMLFQKKLCNALQNGLPIVATPFAHIAQQLGSDEAAVLAETKNLIAIGVTASTHDSKHIDEFIENENHSVWADSAYMDKKRKAALEERGVFCGIIQKRVRGHEALTQA